MRVSGKEWIGVGASACERRPRVSADLVPVRRHGLDFVPSDEAAVSNTYWPEVRVDDGIPERVARDDVLCGPYPRRVEDRQTVVVHGLVPIVEVNRDETAGSDQERQG